MMWGEISEIEKSMIFQTINKKTEIIGLLYQT